MTDLAADDFDLAVLFFLELMEHAAKPRMVPHIVADTDGSLHDLLDWFQVLPQVLEQQVEAMCLHNVDMNNR